MYTIFIIGVVCTEIGSKLKDFWIIALYLALSACAFAFQIISVVPEVTFSFLVTRVSLQVNAVVA